MTTQEIINDMRSHTITSMRAAADRLEELQKKCNMHYETICELTKERDEARAAVIEVKRQRDLYRTQRDATHADAAQASFELERLKTELHDTRLENSGQALQLERTRPEPSRLEIAAMAMQSFISSSGFIIDIPKVALEYADALIAAAKEAK